jgi:hypothetical protein
MDPGSVEEEQFLKYLIEKYTLSRPGVPPTLQEKKKIES